MMLKAFFKSNLLICLCCLITACASSSKQYQNHASVVSINAEATAYIYLPPSAPPYPVVIDLHGCNGIWQARNQDWLPFFLTQNIAVIQVDSFTKRGTSNVCDNLYRVKTIERTFDVAATIQFILQDTRFNHKGIFLAGMSHGGTTALLTNLYDSAVFSKLQGVVAYYPYCPDLLPVLNADLLVLIGGKDDWTPARQCTQMRIVEKNRHEVKIQVYANAYHSFDVPGTDEVYYGHRVAYDDIAARNSRQMIQKFISRRLQ